MGGHSSGPGRFPGLDAVVRRRPNDQHLPTFGDETEESDGDARSAETRPKGDRREHGLLQQDAPAAFEAIHSSDPVDPFVLAYGREKRCREGGRACVGNSSHLSFARIGSTVERAQPVGRIVL